MYYMMVFYIVRHRPTRLRPLSSLQVLAALRFRSNLSASGPCRPLSAQVVHPNGHRLGTELIPSPQRFEASPRGALEPQSTTAPLSLPRVQSKLASKSWPARREKARRQSG